MRIKSHQNRHPQEKERSNQRSRSHGREQKKQYRDDIGMYVSVDSRAPYRSKLDHFSKLQLEATLPGTRGLHGATHSKHH